MSRHRRVGVAGLGSIGRQHLAALTEHGDVAALGFDPSEALRDRVRDEFAADTRSSFTDLLDAGLDALVVASPDRFHLPQVAGAVVRGIPVLVEKPLTVSLDDGALLDQIRASGVSVVMGYVLRHRTVLRQVRELLSDGAIGEPAGYQVMLGAYGTIVAAESRFASAERDRLLRDYSHEWDYLRWFFGPVAEVVARTHVFDRVPHVESPNIADVLLVHESGISGAAHLDYVEPVGVRTIHVLGAGGSLFADLSRGSISLRAAGAEERLIAVPESAGSGLRRQIDHLLAVADGAEPLVTLDDGVAALAVAEAVASSARDRSWVSVDGAGAGRKHVGAVGRKTVERERR